MIHLRPCVAGLFFVAGTSFAQIDALTGLPGDAPLADVASINRQGIPIQAEFEVAPAALPAEHQTQTLVFTIRNINQAYGGKNRIDSVRLKVGDRFRINLGNCVSTIVRVNPVESNLGEFTTALTDANKSVVVTYEGPDPEYFELNAYVRIAIVIETGELPGSSCASAAHPAPASCGAFYQSIGTPGTFNPTLVYGHLILGCASDLGSDGPIGPSGATGPAGPTGATGPVAGPVSPPVRFPGSAIPPAWQAATAYATPMGVSSDSGKQYKLVTPSCTSGAIAPAGTGACSVTTTTVCTAIDGTNGHQECPAGETCTNSISDGGCIWQYLGLAHSGAATWREFVYTPTDVGSDSDGLNGDDVELIAIRGYNVMSGYGLRQDTSEYGYYEVIVPGWTTSGASRNSEWMVKHTTPGGTNWPTFVSNGQNVQTEAATFDFTWQTTPSRIGLQVVDFGAAFGGSVTGHGELEVLGSGALYLRGTSPGGGRLTFEGTTNDTNETSLYAVNPTAPRAIALPDADGTVVVSGRSPTSGPAGWAADGVSCTAACTSLGQTNCANAVCIAGTGAACTALGETVACSVTDQARLCQCY